MQEYLWDHAVTAVGMIEMPQCAGWVVDGYTDRWPVFVRQRQHDECCQARLKLPSRFRPTFHHLYLKQGYVLYSGVGPRSLIHQHGNTWCSTAHTFTAESIKQFQPSPSHSWVSQWLSRAAFIFLPFVYKMPWASGQNVEHNIDGCKSHWPLFHHVVGAEGSLELAEEISCNTGMETDEENGLLCPSSMRVNDCLEVSTGNSTENERRRKRKREEEIKRECVSAVGGYGPGSRSFSTEGFCYTLAFPIISMEVHNLKCVILTPQSIEP